MISFFDPVHLVCERTDSGVFNEPLNLLASTVFFLAAWLLWRDYRKTRKAHDEEPLTLIVLLALMGAGSVALHSAAVRWALYADTAAVALFIAFACYITVRRVLGLTENRTLVFVGGLGGLIALTIPIPTPYRFNDTVAYLPVLGGLALLTWLLFRRGHVMARGFLLATGLLAVGLIFRSLDLAACQSLSIGTFFLWQLCEGMALYRLARMISAPGAPARQPGKIE